MRLHHIALAAGVTVLLTYACVALGMIRLDPPPALEVPRGGPILTDGVLSEGEWKSASEVKIDVADGWSVSVLTQHDNENMYFAFSGVKHGSKRMYPEVLLDAANRKPAEWEREVFWFHVSHNLCEGNGEHDVYTRDGVFQCAHTKPGWAGNNPPQESTDVVEIQISFQKLGLKYHPGMKIGLSLEVTDATGDASQIWKFWPKSAKLSDPSSWSTAVIE